MLDRMDKVNRQSPRESISRTRFNCIRIVVWMLDRIKYAVGHRNPSEPMGRTRLECTLRVSIAEEMEKYKYRLSSSMCANPLNGTAPKPLMLKYETKMALPIEEEGEKIDIQGRANYTLWYGSREDLATSLAVIETRPNKVSEAKPQVWATLVSGMNSKRTDRKNITLPYIYIGWTSQHESWRYGFSLVIAQLSYKLENQY